MFRVDPRNSPSHGKEEARSPVGWTDGPLRRLIMEKWIYLETQMSAIQSDLPIFEYASDIYRTVAHQDKPFLRGIGISNYLFPNEHAIRKLTHSYGFECS